MGTSTLEGVGKEIRGVEIAAIIEKGKENWLSCFSFAFEFVALRISKRWHHQSDTKKILFVFHLGFYNPTVAQTVNCFE